ncbi:MAG: hypothetical protein R3E66_12835 [bacterium]
MALNWNHIESEPDREAIFARLSASLERSTPTPSDILRVENLLRDTTVSNALRREVSRALLKHTRRESTQRLPLLWAAKSSDEEFRATDEIELSDVTAVVSGDQYPMLNEEPTAERDWDDMPLPAEASIDASGILSMGDDALLAFVPGGRHTLRFHSRVYDGVDAEGVLSLLRRGMLLGMDVMAAHGWERVVDDPRFQRLVEEFDNEIERVMARLDVISEPETQEDLTTSGDITRPFDPGPVFPFDEIDDLFETSPTGPKVPDPSPEPPTMPLVDTKPSRPLPPGPLELANSAGVALDRQGDTMVARPSKMAATPPAMPPTPPSEPGAHRVPTAELRFSVPATATVQRPAPAEPSSKAWMWVLLACVGAAGLAAYGLNSAPPEPKVITAPPFLFEAVEAATAAVDEAAAVNVEDPAFWREAAQNRDAEGNYTAAKALYQHAFELLPNAEDALKVARFEAQQGQFSASRTWLKKAADLGASDDVVVAQLRQMIELDETLRVAAREYVPPAQARLVWDRYRREYRVILGTELIGVFVPDQGKNQPWGPQVAEYRLCQVIGCSHRVARAFPAFVQASRLELHRGVRATDGVVQGGFVEVPQVALKRVPIEVEQVWAPWLSVSKPLPEGPYGKRLLAWDNIDPDLRLDFTNLAGQTMTSVELARQIASLFLVDALTGNTSRTTTRPINLGRSTGFDGRRIVSLDPPAMAARPEKRVEKRIAQVERLDRFTWLGLQAMTRDSMFGAMSMLTRKQQDAFWAQRDRLVTRYAAIEREVGPKRFVLTP